MPEVSDIHSVKAGHGTLIIKPIKENNYIEKGNVKLYLDTTFQKEKHTITYGEVISVCNTIDESLKTTIEVKKGDIVFFHYLAVLNSIRDKKYLICDNNFYYSVPYSSLYVAKRTEDVICLNGYNLISPIKKHTEDRIGKVLLPNCMLIEDQVSRGRIAFIGNPLTGEKSLASIGDNIIFRKSSSVPIQYDLHSSFDGENVYYRMKNDSILAVETTSQT